MQLIFKSEISKADIEIIKNIILIYENHLSLLYDTEHDKLTGLLNRHTFDIKLTKLLSAQKNKKNNTRNGNIDNRIFSNSYPAWLAILDIDFFKNINDTYGHVAGDEVLLRLSQSMQKSLRNSDMLFRFGGEEFVIILEPIPYDMAHATLERLRKTIEELQFPLVGHLTISIGFAQITTKDYPTTILEFADKALYYSKENGRNSTHNYELLLQERKLELVANQGSIDLF